jgi:hypothetical protein
MPSPVDILNDPNYVKANTATKEAMFNAGVATLPEYRSANPATQADIRRQFGLETPKERYIRQQLTIQKEQKTALRDTGGKISSFVSGAERGLKSVADKLSYLNPLEYIPDPFTSKADRARIEKQRANYAAERQQANPTTFAGGKIGGEIAGTLPFTMGGGAAVQLGGRALTKVLPRAGAVVEKVGRSIVRGGTGVAAPTRAAETSGKIIAQTRRARNAYRAAGGAGSSTIAAGLTDQDMVDAALAGAAVPVVGHILKFGAGKTYDLIMSRAGPVEAARILREVISDNASQIEKALRNAPKKLRANTAEFLASRGLLTPDLAAATRIASASKQNAPLLAMAQRRATGQNRMRQVISGGETQTEAVGNIAATKKALQDVTGPQREGALTASDVGRTQVIPLEREAARLRQLASEEAENARRLLTANDRSATLIRESGLRLPADIKRQREIVAGLERFGGEAADRSVTAGADARAAEAAAANLRAQGLNPLDISGLVSTLRQKASDAEFVSPDRFKILSEFANNLERRAAKMGGVIDATGLYLARREMGSFVSSILNTSDPKALRQGTAQLIGEAQPLIDDAIKAAGGKGWREYLNTFAEGMKGIERQQFQRELSKLPEARFAKVMKGEDPDFVEANFGPGRYDINAEMQGADLATANKLGRDIEAQRAVAQTGLEDLSQSQKLNFAQGVGAKVGAMIEPSVPNAFTAGARLVGSLPKVGGGGVAAQQFGVRAAEKASERTMGALAPALASPREAGALLRVKPAEDYINKMLYGSQGAPARQQIVSQIATQNVTPPTTGQQYGFPDFDPESGEPLVDIDFSEGYPVPIYGRLPKDMQFKSLNSMRR